MARSIRDPLHPKSRLELARPSVVLALGLLIANDHVFKQQFPGWVTGKLSDAAGLFVLGALLAWLLPRRIPISLITAGIAFAFWKSELSTPLIAAWNHLNLLPVARVVDFTDLLMLPCLALGARRWLPSEQLPVHTLRPRSRHGDFAVAMVSLLAFAATSKAYVSFNLKHHGGPRTITYAGSTSELAAMLATCRVDWYPENEDGKVGVYIETPRFDGIYLRGRYQGTALKTVVTFDEGSSDSDPNDTTNLVNHSISALEACLNPPEIDLPTAETRDAAHLLGDIEGTFVVLSQGRTIVHNASRATTRFPPASTFKIPNMFIALETGVATGPDFLIPWDGKKPGESHPGGGQKKQFWASSWSRDHTLRTAIQDGVLWYFQEIARRIGRERMAAYVRRFSYGNREVSGPIDQFWLSGPLEISAREQVEFLRRFHERQLDLSTLTTMRARDILVLETTERTTLSGKTGSTWLPSGRLLAWLVGYAERDDVTHIFALNLDCPDFESCDLMMRRRLAVAILDDWGILLPTEQSQVLPARQ